MANETDNNERVGAAKLVDESKVNKVDAPVEVDESLMKRGAPGTTEKVSTTPETSDGDEKPAADLSKLPKDDQGNPRDLTMDEAKQLKETVIAELKTIFDPEIPVNIYELGMIYNVSIGLKADVKIKMTLTSPACPVADKLPGEVEQKIRELPQVTESDVELVWKPQWDKSMMSEAAKLELNVT